MVINPSYHYINPSYLQCTVAMGNFELYFMGDPRTN